MRLNDLFDVLNSRRQFDQCFNKRAISRGGKSPTEEQHLKLLQDSDEWLGRWAVGDGSVHIDSVAGLQRTIRGVQVIWERLTEKGSSTLCTRRLNQDGLENLFGVVRQRGEDRDHPDPTQFRHAYKHAVLNSLMSPSETANCEADGDSLIVALREAAPAPRSEQPSAPVDAPAQPVHAQPVAVDGITANCIVYVAGYLLHKECTCTQCMAVLSKGSDVAEMSSETLTALKAHTSITDMDVGSLKLPTPAFTEFVTECYAVFTQYAQGLSLETGICRKLVSRVLASEQAAALEQQLCLPRVLSTMASKYMRLMLHKLCQRLTSERSVGTPARKVRKLVKLQR